MVRGATAVLRTRVGSAIATHSGVADDHGSIDFIGGAHPLPDTFSVRAALRALDVARSARQSGETLLVLLSGGASAMMAAPVDGITLEDKRETIAALMRAGADIRQLNCVRKHLSSVKGGRLAAAAGSALTLAISDVHDPDDDLATIGSGPTTADPTTYADALAVVDALQCEVPDRVHDHFTRGAAGMIEETPKPGDSRLRSSSCQVIASRRTAMAGATREASRRGYAVHVIERATRGEARDAGLAFAQTALAPHPKTGSMCIVASGETTVRVRGNGRGGRNQEFVLGGLRVLAGHQGTAVMASIGTDGIDGPTDAAGAIAAPTTLARMDKLGIDVERVLANNDAYAALEHVDGLVRWGPTGTNVGDLHLMLTMKE
jgi:glycerate-2-kinase